MRHSNRLKPWSNLADGLPDGDNLGRAISNSLSATREIAPLNVRDPRLLQMEASPILRNTQIYVCVCVHIYIQTCIHTYIQGFHAVVPGNLFSFWRRSLKGKSTRAPQMRGSSAARSNTKTVPISKRFPSIIQPGLCSSTRKATTGKPLGGATSTTKPRGTWISTTSQTSVRQKV